MNNKINYPLSKETINKQDIDSLCEWFQTSPRFTMGELTPKVEEKCAKWTGRKYSIFVNSGSSANLLAAYVVKLGLEKKYGQNNKTFKVILPSIGWSTTLSPWIQLGFESIMCGPDPKNFCMDLDKLEELCIKHNPEVVIFVSALGILCDKNKLLDLKNKYGFSLIMDDCAAHGSAYKDGTKAGSIGDISTISTYFGHSWSTFEGGFCFTDDKEIYELLLQLRSHGWSKQNTKEKHEELIKKYNIDDFHSPFTFYVPGFNVRPTDINSFIGLRQLDKIDGFFEQRHENHIRYSQNLKGWLEYQDFSNNKLVASISFGALAHNNDQRRKIVKHLVKNGIETRIYSAGSLDQHPQWFERYPKINDPTSLKIHSTGFFLPNNADMAENDVDFISNVVITAIRTLE